jgi:DsbC/DsbD-like thiol-disulfide interchange protein
MLNCTRLVLAMTLLCLAWPLQAVPSAQAASSPWVKKLGARLRLIGGTMPASSQGPAQLMVGLQVELEPEWKTYWRNPGDGGGVPPSFEWRARSKNVAGATVLYPTPVRFTDSLGDSLGYHDSVTFPLLIKATDSNQPTTIATDVFLGICNDICVPVELAVDLALVPNDPPAADEAAVLQQALDNVPKPEGGAKSSAPAIGKVTAQPAGGGAIITIEALVPSGVTITDLLVDAEDGSFVPLPVPAPPAGDGLARFAIDTSRLTRPPKLAGKAVRLTLITSKGAVEAQRTLPN